MNCAQVRAALPEFVYGGLTPQVQALVDDHLKGCAECGRETAALRDVRGLLIAAPDVSINTPAIYRVAAARQMWRVRRWRRMALTACAAVFLLLAATALTRLEIHVGNSEMVLRRGPASAPPAPRPPAPRIHLAPVAVTKPVDLSSIQDRLRTLSELTQALAEDDQDRDAQREREIAYLREQMKEWQGQSAQCFGRRRARL